VLANELFSTTPWTNSHTAGSAQDAFFRDRDNRAGQATPANVNLIPILHADGRPTHELNENGVPYPSALAMLKEKTGALKGEIAAYKYLPTQSIQEYCELYTKATTMTKYKRVQIEVIARKAHSDRQDETEWDERVNKFVQEHIAEMILMAGEAHEFLISRLDSLINQQVIDALQDCLDILENAVPRVANMDQSYMNYDELEASADEMPKALYDLNWKCLAA
jgi:hypothetical protein